MLPPPSSSCCSDERTVDGGEDLEVVSVDDADMDIIR